MIRRVVGIAHVADIDFLEDSALRAAVERRVLVLGRALVLASIEGGNGFNSIDELAITAKSLYDADIPGDVWPVNI